MDMTTETSALHIEKLIHLNKLSPSKRNVRKNGSTPVKQLAASIKRVGLLQNLIVTASSEGEGLFEVEGGKRRLIALNLLAKRKQIAPDYDVRCLVVPDAAAVTVSLTENMLREAMHPADEFAAFQVLIDEGKSVEDIAADFGVTPLVVSRRLRLANLSARLLKDYRSDKVTLEQLMALAITDDHAAQDTAFYSAPAWQQGARELRARLTEQEIEADRDGVARFVGLEAYSAAGGAVRRDLFADDGKGIYLSDRELLDKLAIEKLAATAESVKAEGWSWSDVAPRTTSSDFYAFQRVRASRRKPTAQEAKKLVKLQKRSEEIETVLNGSDDLDDATRETLSEENDGIDAEQAELQNGLQVYAKKMPASLV